MDNAREAVLHFLARETKPLHRSNVCNDLQRIGAVSELVPHMMPWDWHGPINELIDEGRITETPDGLQIVRLAFEPKQSKEQQATLF